MNIKHASSSDLCRQLAAGWPAEYPEAPRELLVRLRARWQGDVECERPSTSAYLAVLALNQVHLLGASALGCLVLGHGAKVEQEVNEFWQQHGGPGRLALILAATTKLREAVQRILLPARCLLLGDGEIEGLLTHPHPLELLKEHLRRQIPLRRLLPYDFMHPAPANMFFGRRDILRRMHEEELKSFAIAGPGRIGKSSLLRQYHYEMRRNFRDDRRQRLFLIDCYPYGGFDADQLAQRLALHVSADSEANRVNASTLPRFLKRRSLEGERPLELLLDEVDSVCLNAAFDQLAEAVRSNYCRVILCGRSNLYRVMKNGTHQFEDRLELLRPEPLDFESAKQLLLNPLSDLGILPEDEMGLLRCVFGLSARRPHLIQYCANRLFQFAEADASTALTARHLQRLREEFMAMSRSMLPLEDMHDDWARLMALLWLEEGGGNVTVGSLQRLAKEHGLTLTASKALDICDQLWICNVLTWERGVQALASSHLVEFVRRMDFSNEIARLKHLLAPTQT
jgi:hypothetical protein